MDSASALASSVLPTPVGPRNRKVATGLLPSRKPARDSRTASATARTASSCPTRRSCSRCSRCSSFSRSSTVNSLTGMPVRRETIWATCSALTSALPEAAPLPALDQLLELGLLGLDALAELGGLVVLLARGHVILFTPQLVQFGLQLLHGHRPGRGRQLHARGRLVEQVDGLVGQKRAVM